MDIALRREFGKNVKKYRTMRALTQEKLSETAGIDYKYLQRIEGKNPPNIKLETISKLAKALKVDSSKLLES